MTFKIFGAGVLFKFHDLDPLVVVYLEVLFSFAFEPDFVKDISLLDGVQDAIPAIPRFSGSFVR